MATTLITGANRGIGLELARQLKARGDDVIAAVRESSADLEALGVRVVTDVDVTDDESVARLAKAVADETLDLLVLNAGVLIGQSLDNLDFADTLKMFEVNAVGPLRVARALRPQLKDGAKVGIVTSRMGSLADNTSGGSYGYRMSKAAVNAAGVSLAHDLKGAGVSVVLLHPGWVRTDMTGGRGLVDTPESAEGLIARLDELGPATTGSFKHMNGETLPW
jgi:NAD(P)-dependent dehydrogenase (short-subunit alcohol dehydrogenase family)